MRAEASEQTRLEEDAGWRRRFWEGDRDAIEQCYRATYSAVDAAVGRVLRGADRESVVHEVYARLLSDEQMRRNFGGGLLRAWLATVARNQAIDFLRRKGREDVVDPARLAHVPAEHATSPIDAVEAHLSITRFQRDHLPDEWLPLFRVRFLQQLPQRDAARELGMSRTTLAVREARIKKRLRTFLLRDEEKR